MTVITKVGKLHKAGRKGQQRWRVKYWLGDDPKPKTKYMGPAEGSDKLTRTEADRLKARWIQECGATPGKAHAAKLPTLEEHIEHYFATSGKRCNSQVQACIRQSCKKLTTFFGSSRRINSITSSDADRFLGYLQDSGLADATIKSHIGNVKGLMRLAVQDYQDHFPRSPFAHVNVKAKPGKGDWRYVSYSDVLLALDACADEVCSSELGWQTLIGLCRFAGLRVFSEALELKKADVDLMSDPPLIKVYGSKTARQSGTPSRVVPVLFPILKDLLLRSISESSPAEIHVVPSCVPRRRSNAHDMLSAILKRAGLVDDNGRTLWRPAFKVLRACCEKDFLSLGLSEYRYCQAMGHSPEVSRAYYLAKFEDATLADDARDEFQAAAERVRLALSDTNQVYAGYTDDSAR